ncbi:MAG: UDP-N-acetylglucosamine 1-carboxyvinyltransferase [Planctomycetota bacterium]|nr:MAG: UDP-N-acetylglucosamine 1-carboxyvinyltransferase [Planctomycetota bacterium]
MDRFSVLGGRPLQGQVTVSGSKNAALPLLAASLLCEGTVEYQGMPELRDVATLRELLQGLGAVVEGAGSAARVSAPAEGPTEAPYEMVRRMRASVCVLGPLLARRGRARVSLPGGCVIGERPIDLHLKGLAALGARIEIEHGTVVAEAPPGGLRGTRVYLASRNGSTVLGTANVMMAAVLARGVTVIDAAAEEPEVVGLAEFLNSCGACVSGAGGNRLVIEGVPRLRGGMCTIPPDRVEAGTLILAAAITCGDVRVLGCRPGELAALLDLLQRAGVPCNWGEDPEGGGGRSERPGWVHVSPWQRRPQVLDVVARPYPGFPTDLQAQWLAFCTVGEGLGLVTDAVYPDRFMHVAELNRLGAGIRREGSTAMVFGPARLSGAPVTASDLRASASLILAGLVARGQTIVRRVYHLDRGYERLEEKLRSLGAAVERETDPEPP